MGVRQAVLSEKESVSKHFVIKDKTMNFNLLLIVYYYPRLYVLMVAV